LGLTEIEKESFFDNWNFPLLQTSRTNFELFFDSDPFNKNPGSINKVANDFYFYRAQQRSITRWLRHILKKYIWFWMSKEEKAFWNHYLTKILFDAWAENVEGVKRGLRVDQKAQSDFFKYAFDRLEIHHEPKYSSIYENYLDTDFGMRMLRPNNQSHIYLAFSFKMRPLKKFIRQYLDMAFITGNFETFLRRLPPFHSMLKINSEPGERTSFDLRGLDFTPIIIRNDIKYSLALNLEKIQTRSNDRFITIPVISDDELEQEKVSKIKDLESFRDKQFKKSGQIFNINPTSWFFN